MKNKHQLLVVGVLCVPSIILFLSVEYWGTPQFYVSWSTQQIPMTVAKEPDVVDESDLSDHDEPVLETTSKTILPPLETTRPSNDDKPLTIFDQETTTVSYTEMETTKSPTMQGLRMHLAAREAKEAFLDQVFGGSISRTALKSADVVEANNSLKLILFYTPLFGRLPWRGLETSYNFTHWGHKACREINCRITYDKAFILSADVVLFHGRDMPSVSEMRKMSIGRSAAQRWVYFMHENPIFTYYDPGLYNGLFNWTMTYRRDSDIFIPYRFYAPLTTKDQVPKTENYATGKDKLVAWLVGHCGNVREEYAKKLSEYIQVDVYGNCAKNFNQSNDCPRGSPECEAKLKRYKFYLSFENGICMDYITEKYWHTPFAYDMVPIVMGGSDYGPEVAIPGSYINVSDFPSVQSLAEYLHYLNKNNNAYNKYFKWRQRYKLAPPETWTCQMCAMLNQKMEHKTYHDLRKFWGINETCTVYEEKLNKLINVKN